MKKTSLLKCLHDAENIFFPAPLVLSVNVEVRMKVCNPRAEKKISTPGLYYGITIFYETTNKETGEPDFSNLSGIGRTWEAAIEDTKQHYNNDVQLFFGYKEDVLF